MGFKSCIVYSWMISRNFLCFFSFPAHLWQRYLFDIAALTYAFKPSFCFKGAGCHMGWSMESNKCNQLETWQWQGNRHQYNAKGSLNSNRTNEDEGISFRQDYSWYELILGIVRSKTLRWPNPQWQENKLGQANVQTVQPCGKTGLLWMSQEIPGLLLS